MRAAYRDPLPITVDEWSGDGDKLIRCHARLASEVVAFATFDAVVRENRTLRIALRHGTLVLREHMPEPWQTVRSGT